MPFKYRSVRLDYHKRYNEKWYELNKNERKKDIQRKNQIHKELLFDILGRKCVKCGFDDPRVLQFDHLKGHGRKDRNKWGGGFYRYYAQHPELALALLQVLCANCNWIKRHELNEHLSHVEIVG